MEIAFALLELDQVDGASERAGEAMVAALRLRLPNARGEAYRCMAWCALMQGDAATGAACLLEQVRAFDRHDGMIDRVAETAFTAGISAALAGRPEAGRRLWASGVVVFDQRGLSTDDFPRGLLELAQHLDLPGGDALSDDLAVVLREVVAAMESIRGTGDAADTGG
jgi:hypothetical protein